MSRVCVQEAFQNKTTQTKTSQTNKLMFLLPNFKFAQPITFYFLQSMRTCACFEILSLKIGLCSLVNLFDTIIHAQHISFDSFIKLLLKLSSMKAYENTSMSWVDLSQSPSLTASGNSFPEPFEKNTLALSQHVSRHLQLPAEKTAECNHSFLPQLGEKWVHIK